MEYEDTMNESVSKEFKALETLSVPEIYYEPSTTFEVEVTDPKPQVGQGRSFVVYTVNSKRLSDDKTFNCFRRYSDFLWLHDVLALLHPSCVIPHVPEKNFTGNFTSEVIVYRTRELSKFLRRIAAHPVLSADENFASFVTAPWTEITEKRANPMPPPVGPVEAKATSFISSLFGGNSTAALPAGEEDPWFDEQLVLIGKIELALNKALESSLELAKKWQAVSVAESTHSIDLRVTGKVLEKTDEDSATRIGFFRNAVVVGADLTKAIGTNTEHILHDSIKDYLREISAIRDVILKRNLYIKAYTSAIKAVEAKKSGYEELERKRDLAKTELEDFSTAARADIQRTLDNRRKEFLSVIEAYAKVNAEYAVKTSEQWDAAATASIAGGPASVPDLRGKVPEQAPAQQQQQEEQEQEENAGGIGEDAVTPILSSTGSETSPYAADDE